MKTNQISPKNHALLDYALVGALFIAPSLLKMNRTARNIYLAEAAILLPYIALTKQPLSLKGMIPFKTHGKIDPVNVARFALLTFFKPFRRTRKEMIFNIVFTAMAGISVLLTDWNSGDRK